MLNCKRLWTNSFNALLFYCGAPEGNRTPTSGSGVLRLEDVSKYSFGPRHIVVMELGTGSYVRVCLRDIIIT